jgi:CHAT domain-containing protein
VPLHAAGIYTHHKQAAVESCSEYMVSSYIPTLDALLKAQEGVRRISLAKLKALLIAEPYSPGFRSLPETVDEVQLAAKMIPPSSILSLNDQTNLPSIGGATIQMVSQRLPKASMLHLACHGIQDPMPLESGFCLRDGRLTIAELMRLKSPDASFAFLSACESAKGSKAQADQAVHLASAMLFAGFKSVVATMWYVASPHLQKSNPH